MSLTSYSVFLRSFRKYTLLFLLLFAAMGCKELQENMLPSGEDKRVVDNSVHDFTAFDTTGTARTLSTDLVGKTGALLYFTMWCPVCNAHTDSIVLNLVAKYPNVQFYLVDYVSANWSNALINQMANGYTLVPMTVLSDASGQISAQFNGTMGMVAVINAAGKLILNQDYQDGATVDTVLSTL